MIKRTAIGLAFLLPMLLGVASLRAETAGVRIVVNSKSELTGLKMEDLSRIFIGKSAEFPNGSKAIAVDQLSDSQTYAFFIEKVHGRTVNAMKGYWARQVFSGRGSPLRQMSGDAEVIEFVKSNPGGIGYVSESADVEGAKVVPIDGKPVIR